MSLLFVGSRNEGATDRVTRCGLRPPGAHRELAVVVLTG